MESTTEQITENGTSTQKLRSNPKFTLVFTIAWTGLVTLILAQIRAMSWGFEGTFMFLLICGFLSIPPALFVYSTFGSRKTTLRVMALLAVLPVIFVNAYFIPEESQFVAEYDAQDDYFYSANRKEPFESCSMFHDEGGFWATD